MRKIFSRRKRLLSDKSGLATIEFALASTALTIGLLNGLEVARWSLQRMQMANAVHSATLAVWNACDTKHLPAISNCSGLNSAISTGLQTTSLGTAVTLATNYPQEGYYCINTSGVLIKAANYNATTIPSDCSTYSDSSHAPGDYVLVQATYNYTPLISSSLLSVGSSLPSTFTSTGWIRLK
jgi:Flp pilus assembly protein TadG